MSKVSIIGGGAWGSTLAQVLSDNQHEVLVYDVNGDFVDKINHHIHPVFNSDIPKNIRATKVLDEVVSFADIILLSVPTKAMRNVLFDINQRIHTPKTFINVSKGIEPGTLKRVSEIVLEEISPSHLKGFVVLTGPSHAEEVILRKVTLLVSSSTNELLAKEVQMLFANDQYLRVYTSKDLIGCEVGGTVKNAIAVISGACTGLGMGENARAAVITRGIIEVIKVVEMMGGKRETAYGLTGIGDLIVTASSEHSRNFKAGKRIGQGDSLDVIFSESSQTIEGIRSIEALHDLSLKNQVELPMINVAYEIIHQTISIEEGMKKLLKRELKAEDFS